MIWKENKKETRNEEFSKSKWILIKEKKINLLHLRISNAIYSVNIIKLMEWKRDNNKWKIKESEK